MNNISSIVYEALDKHAILEEKELKSLTNNLEFRLLFSIDFNKSFKEAKKDFIKNYLNDLLTLSLGNVTLAAKKANLHRRHFHRMLHEHELNPKIHRKELIKPSQYMKENLQNILEDSLININEEEKLQTVYSSLNDISQIITEIMRNIPYEKALEIFEKEFIEKTLKKYQYDLKKTAESLEVSERTLYRKLNKLGIVMSS